MKFYLVFKMTNLEKNSVAKLKSRVVLWSQMFTKSELLHTIFFRTCCDIFDTLNVLINSRFLVIKKDNKKIISNKIKF